MHAQQPVSDAQGQTSDVNLQAHLGKGTALIGRNGLGKIAPLKPLMDHIPTRTDSTEFNGKKIPDPDYRVMQRGEFMPGRWQRYADQSGLAACGNLVPESPTTQPSPTQRKKWE
ncbi:hypothetical protein [Polaromonas sp.]|uniref:hypothetical protein n=1 Tax=Polaromonas sp. TaxID=1869339 RepID=UPI0017F6DFF1|nr:hypothetical protein [Polaromonas sp.]NML87397.1 hypothetical protein [Polaromonas sp.]